MGCDRTERDGRRSAPRSPRSSSGSPPGTAPGDPGESKACCSSPATGSVHPLSAGSWRPWRFPRHRNGAPTRPGGSSCTHKPRRC